MPQVIVLTVGLIILVPLILLIVWYVQEIGKGGEMFITCVF